MASMLYYPFANAPVEVANRAVLYWDGLSTEVAPGWEERIGPHMAAINEMNFYHPIEAMKRYELSLNEIGPEIEYAVGKSTQQISRSRPFRRIRSPRECCMPRNALDSYRSFD